MQLSGVVGQRLVVPLGYNAVCGQRPEKDNFTFMRLLISLSLTLLALFIAVHVDVLNPTWGENSFIAILSAAALFIFIRRLGRSGQPMNDEVVRTKIAYKSALLSGMIAFPFCWFGANMFLGLVLSEFVLQVTLNAQIYLLGHHYANWIASMGEFPELVQHATMDLSFFIFGTLLPFVISAITFFVVMFVQRVAR
jgi:hypothetical protein